MRRGGVVGVLALVVGACAPTSEERLHAYNTAGVRQFQDGDFDRARADFQAALALRPNDPSLLYNLGRSYEELGQADRAEQCYRMCLRQNPDQAECRHTLDALLVKRGRFAEAQQMVQDWLTRRPNLSAAYAEDGWLYQQEGDPIKAVKRYQQAINCDPHNTRALIALGEIYEQDLNHAGRALLLYQTALSYDPNQPDLVRRVSRLKERGVGPPRPES